MLLNLLSTGMARLTSILQKAELFIGVVFLFVMLVSIVVNIVFRYLLNHPLFWSDELSNYLFIWMTFLASAYVMGDDRHVRVTAVLDRLPPRAAYVVNLVMNLIMLLVFGAFVLPSVAILGNLRRSNMMRIPLAYIYAIIPISFVLMALHVVNNIIRDAIKNRHNQSDFS